MTTPLPGNTSGTARLIAGAPSYAVGWQEPVYVKNPPAGQAFTYTADGRYYERVIAVTFNLVTSAVVADRFGELFLEDTNGTIITAVPIGGNVVASSTLNVFLTADAPSYSGGGSGGTFGKLPDVLIPPGWQWVLDVFSMDAADVVNDIVVLVQRFPSDTAAISAG
jgi:hypothetical protein